MPLSCLLCQQYASPCADLQHDWICWSITLKNLEYSTRVAKAFGLDSKVWTGKCGCSALWELLFSYVRGPPAHCCLGEESLSRRHFWKCCLEYCHLTSPRWQLQELPSTSPRCCGGRFFLWSINQYHVWTDTGWQPCWIEAFHHPSVTCQPKF